MTRVTYQEPVRHRDVESVGDEQQSCEQSNDHVLASHALDTSWFPDVQIEYWHAHEQRQESRDE